MAEVDGTLRFVLADEEWEGSIVSSITERGGNHGLKMLRLAREFALVQVDIRQ